MPHSSIESLLNSRKVKLLAFKESRARRIQSSCRDVLAELQCGILERIRRAEQHGVLPRDATLKDLWARRESLFRNDRPRRSHRQKEARNAGLASLAQQAAYRVKKMGGEGQRCIVSSEVVGQTEQSRKVGLARQSTLSPEEQERLRNLAANGLNRAKAILKHKNFVAVLAVAINDASDDSEKEEMFRVLENNKVSAEIRDVEINQATKKRAQRARGMLREDASQDGGAKFDGRWLVLLALAASLLPFASTALTHICRA